MQGSLSYTVIATTAITERIVSFRVPEARLAGPVDELAHDIHGDLVPKSTYHATIGEGEADGKSQPLLVYSMPLLPGKSCVEALDLDLDPDEAGVQKHINLAKHLARYFARSWLRPQKPDTANLQETREFVLKKLSLLDEEPRFAYLKSTLAELRGDKGVKLLFSPEYSQVLNHGDLSQTNLLIDEDTATITGIIDWSRGKVEPFGIELPALRMLFGTMTSEGWSDFSCRSRIDEAFWSEFWSVTGIEDPAKRSQLRSTAELAGKLGLILKYAFQKTLDGVPLDKLATRPARYMEAWLGAPKWSSLILRGSVVDQVSPVDITKKEAGTSNDL
ncbi:hypothetical protein GGR56DRAFT_684215 [Xylariaceae sp. FL0804]|nr:hypothetical protein GGR56DRAFT_684215 [Xylariaceae sp. FL0804]